MPVEFAVSLQRTEYFEDLLEDARIAAADVPPGESQQIVQLMAALVMSDALNGIRKALLDLAEATRKAGRE